MYFVRSLPSSSTKSSKKEEKKAGRKEEMGRGEEMTEGRDNERQKEDRQTGRQTGKLDYTWLDALKLSHQLKFPSGSLLEGLQENIEIDSKRQKAPVKDMHFLSILYDFRDVAVVCQY